MPRLRGVTRALLVWNVAFIVLAVVPALLPWCGSGDLSNDGCAMGTGFLLMALYGGGAIVWFVGNVALGIAWFVTGPSPTPRLGVIGVVVLAGAFLVYFGLAPLSDPFADGGLSIMNLLVAGVGLGLLVFAARLVRRRRVQAGSVGAADDRSTTEHP